MTRRAVIDFRVAGEDRKRVRGRRLMNRKLLKMLDGSL